MTFARERGVPYSLDDAAAVSGCLDASRYHKLLHGSPGWLPPLAPGDLLGIQIRNGAIETLAVGKREVRASSPLDATLANWLSCSMANGTSTTQPRRFYSPQEVAELLGVSPTTVMTRIHEGALPAVRVSERIFRIPIAAFERFVSTSPVPEFEIQYRRVNRVRRLGEPIVPADELVRA